MESVEFTAGDNYVLVHDPSLTNEEIISKILSQVVAPGTRKILGQVGDHIDPGAP